MFKNIRSRKITIFFIVIFVLSIPLAMFLLRCQTDRSVEFRAAEGKFQILVNEKWQDFLIKGVNMGVGKPGFFPGEMQITKEEYLRWFQQIAQMNANTIRVYTILAPEFYEALLEYNLFAEKPLYIFHGVWLDEALIEKYYDAYHPQLIENFEQEVKTLIDVLHGNEVIRPSPGHASGTYRWDVSPYVIGYILGIELDTKFVINTNTENAQITGFEGDYLYTQDASPHECWLARIGDYTIAYESDQYGVQKTISWVNWLTTDPLWHTAEPSKEKEDSVSVDTEHILAKENFTAGLFASYHIYPYYPEFMMFQPEYAEYVDEQGKQDPYEAYLRDLKDHHDVPILVAEFGLPTSRGCTHENVLTGYNQGGLTEEQQGEYVADMFDSIVSADYAGGLIFTWQDEWFKRSWNTMDFDLPDRRPFWSNYQASEQFYGLLAFDPGKDKVISQVDGDISEWADQKPVSKGDGLELYAMSDQKFVYFLIRDPQGDVRNRQYIIGVDSHAEQGNEHFSDIDLSFNHAVDIAIVLNGVDHSTILVDAYYDVYYRQYSLLGIIPHDARFEVKNSGIFNPMRLITSAELVLPLTQEVIPQRSYETGKLLHGNSNPDSPEYNSIADFSFSDDHHSIEIRIPWQLLNVADPSTKMIVGDLYEQDEFNLNATKAKGFSLELYGMEKDMVKSGGLGFYSWDSWNQAVYHERLKESYYIIQEKFSDY